MSTKDKITDFISASADEKPVAAYNAFASAVEDRVQDLLSQKQDEIRSSMFTSEETVEENFSTWTIVVDKPINKLKKGQKVTVKARGSAEAMKKAAKELGDPMANRAPHLKVLSKEEVEGDAE